MTPAPPFAAPSARSPFARLAERLEGIAPGRPPINLSVGEPQHPIPDFVGPVLAQNLPDFGRYPAIRGTDAFREAVAAWLGRRFGLGTALDPARHVVVLSGSREGLFLAALTAAQRKRTERPAILVPNPYYQAYGAGAQAAGAELVPLAATRESGFLPDLDALEPALLERTLALYLATPSNPQGAVASHDYLTHAVALARRHGFMLFLDECYSEIYTDAPPAGGLEAAQGLGGFDQVVVFNSLSKRSSLPGLRIGFAAGDPDFLDAYAQFRNVAGPQVPLPAQAVAVRAYADEAHVEANRALYRTKFSIADQILGGRFGYRRPPGGFFLWLDMTEAGGGEAAAVRLWREAGLRVLPGGYLTTETADGRNPGAAYLRVALVADIETTAEALRRIVGTLT